MKYTQLFFNYLKIILFNFIKIIYHKQSNNTLVLISYLFVLKHIILYQTIYADL